MLASKFLNDQSFTNRAWSKVSNQLFRTEEVNTMERDFLELIGFNLFVDSKAFGKFVEIRVWYAFPLCTKQNSCSPPSALALQEIRSPPLTRTRTTPRAVLHIKSAHGTLLNSINTHPSRRGGWDKRKNSQRKIKRPRSGGNQLKDRVCDSCLFLSISLPDFLSGFFWSFCPFSPLLSS